MIISHCLSNMIHEFKSYIFVHTPHGKGEAIMFMDYNLTTDSVWVVRLSGGRIKHYFSNDIRVIGNPMNGKELDLDIPENWKK